MKNLRYLIEAALIHLLFFILRLLPAKTASDFGGWVGRTIGPSLGASKKALRNLESALPGKSAQAYQIIIRDMWDNLGRVMAEYPHLKTIAEKYTELVEIEPGTLKAPYIFFSGHIANWEMMATSFYLHHHHAPYLIYRAPNNFYLHGLLDQNRSLGGKLPTIPKSRKGARDIMRILQDGHSMGILIDQKYNEGIEADFFGRPAMTSPSFIQLAQKFDVPLLPVRTERLEGCKFRVTVYPALSTTERTVENVLADAHALLEGWISERPGQWLWLHRRWKQVSD